MSELNQITPTHGESVLTFAASQPFAFSNIGTPVITFDKLRGSANYLSWAASVKLWFNRQGQADHLTTKVEDVDPANKARWEQLDAQLCNILWNSIDRSILQLF